MYSPLTNGTLPAGVRKEVEVEGRQVLLFWYRNQIYAIEGRSPSEGAYSEGFIKAKFTQVGEGRAGWGKLPACMGSSMPTSH